MVPVLVRGDDAAKDRACGSRQVAEALADPADVAAALRRGVDDRVGHEPDRGVGEPVEDDLGTRISDVRDEGRAFGHAAEPRLERVGHGALVGEDVRMVPFGAGQDRDVGPVGVEVAGIFVRLDDERRTAAVAGGRRWATGHRARQQRADEGGRIRPGCDERMNEPARCRALAVRAGHADERPADSRVGDDLLPRLERDAGRARGHQLRVVGVDRGEGLGDRDTLRAWGGRDVRGGVLARDHDTDSLHGRRVRRWRAWIAGCHDAAGVDRQDGRRAGPGPGRADDVDPFHRPDGASRPRGLQPGPDSLCGGGHRSFASGGAACSSRSTRSSSAAAALRRLLSDRSPSQRKRRTSAPATSATAT